MSEHNVDFALGARKAAEMSGGFAMTSASTSPDERSRKAMSLFLQRLAPSGTQAHLATLNGVSESTISRTKESAEAVLKMCSQLGLKLVPEDRVCVRSAEIEFLRSVYALVVQQAPWLLNQGDS